MQEQVRVVCTRVLIISCLVYIYKYIRFYLGTEKEQFLTARLRLLLLLLDE